MKRLLHWAQLAAGSLLIGVATLVWVATAPYLINLVAACCYVIGVALILTAHERYQ